MADVLNQPLNELLEGALPSGLIQSVFFKYIPIIMVAFFAIMTLTWLIRVVKDVGLGSSRQDKYRNSGVFDRRIPVHFIKKLFKAFGSLFLTIYEKVIKHGKSK